MGQCVSRKAAGAYGASSTSKPMARPHDYRQYQGQDGNRESSRHSSASHMRGAASSFGFKRRPTSAIIPLPVDNEPTSKKSPTDTAIVDNNGNDDNVDSLETISTTVFSAGRTTPRLAPPKKEANASRINRFGFRQANANRSATRVPDTTSATQATVEYKNNNVEKEMKSRKTVSIAATLPKVKAAETNKNKAAKTSIPQPNAPAKFTLHSSQLPKPQMPVRVMDSKNAKTVANINRKVSSASQRSEEGNSSKEGSVTEDSGVGSHTSGGPNGNFVGDTDTLHGVELMDSSPTFGARKNKHSHGRNLDLIVSGKSFDVIDLDDSTEDGVVTEVAVIPLPRLPSVFGNNMSTGIVRERTMEYERQLDMNRRKISVTSSEGFSEDYGEEEKSFRDRSCTEKSGQGASRLFSPTKSFREPHSRKHSNKDSSPASSDDQEWEQGGEAMAEVYSISFSSSDESKDKEFSPLPLRMSTSNKQTYIDKSHMTSSCTGALPKDTVRSVLLTRDDVKFTSMTDAMTTQMVGSLTGAIPKDTGRSVLLTIEDTKYSPEDMYTNRGAPVGQHMSTSSSSMSSSCSATSRDLYKALLPTVENAECLATNKHSPLESSANSSLLTSPSMTSSSDSLTVPKDNLKSVLLSIEDPKFAAVAAASSGTLLDDETSPVDSLISSYTESEEIVSKHKVKTSKSSTDSKDVNEKSPLSPESPGTPTNASLSLSEGRDFLIDDEIADQPALMFDEPVVTVDRLHSDNHSSSLLFSDSAVLYSVDRYCSEHQNISDSLATLVDSTPKLVRKGLRSCDGSPGPMRARNPLLSRTASIDTLSPCESIASDDLMMDFEHSQNSSIDDSTDRLHLNESNALHSLDEATIRSELENQDASVAREWSSLLGTHANRDLPPHSVTRTNNFLRSRTNTPSSVPDSPRSLDRVRGLASSNALLRSARTAHGSPAAYDSDDSLRLDRITHGSMVNDIVGIKTMLLKLKRVLQESEPHNPFDNQAILKNGLYNGLSNEQSDLDSVDCDSDFASNSSMEMAELRRQIEFLHSQLEDKDRTVQQLQNQVTKYSLGAHLSSGFSDRELCNAATQTDRVRPLSAGPSLLQSLPTEGGMGPLVSANESTRRSRPQSMVETHPSSAMRAPPLKLWRKPGEPPPPSRYAQQVSSLPRRARSRSRPAPTPS